MAGYAASALVTFFTLSEAEIAVANSQLTAGAHVSAAGECASVVSLRGCCRPDATPVPFYVGPLVLHSSSKLSTARR